MPDKRETINSAQLHVSADVAYFSQRQFDKIQDVVTSVLRSDALKTFIWEECKKHAPLKDIPVHIAVSTKYGY